MTTNFYFNNFQNSMEQQLLEDLIVESIKIYGNDVYYLPRTATARDDIYGTDDVALYEYAIPIEMYIRSVDGFEGDGTFLSKFNVEVRDEITLSVALRTFQTEVISSGVEIHDNSQIDLTVEHGPRQGDLIYMPLNNRLFQISYVNEKPVFYQLGSMNFFDLKCHLFEYSGEIIETGVQEIDSIMDKFPVSFFDRSILTESNMHLVAENGLPIVDEEYSMDVESSDEGLLLDDSSSIELEADDFLDFSESNPFADNY